MVVVVVLLLLYLSLGYCEKGHHRLPPASQGSVAENFQVRTDVYVGASSPPSESVPNSWTFALNTANMLFSWTLCGVVVVCRKVFYIGVCDSSDSFLEQYLSQSVVGVLTGIKFRVNKYHNRDGQIRVERIPSQSTTS